MNVQVRVTARNSVSHNISRIDGDRDPEASAVDSLENFACCCAAAETRRRLEHVISLSV